MTEAEARKRLEASGEDIDFLEAKECARDFPDTIRALRKGISDLRALDDVTVAHLYAAWSEEVWSASWLKMAEDPSRDIAAFRAWLLGE